MGTTGRGEFKAAGVVLGFVGAETGAGAPGVAAGTGPPGIAAGTGAGVGEGEGACPSAEVTMNDAMKLWRTTAPKKRYRLGLFVRISFFP